MAISTSNTRAMLETLKEEPGMPESDNLVCTSSCLMRYNDIHLDKPKPFKHNNDFQVADTFTDIKCESPVSDGDIKGSIQAKLAIGVDLIESSQTVKVTAEEACQGLQQAITYLQDNPDLAGDRIAILQDMIHHISSIITHQQAVDPILINTELVAEGGDCEHGAEDCNAGNQILESQSQTGVGSQPLLKADVSERATFDQSQNLQRHTETFVQQPVQAKVYDCIHQHESGLEQDNQLIGMCRSKDCLHCVITGRNLANLLVIREDMKQHGLKQVTNDIDSEIMKRLLPSLAKKKNEEHGQCKNQSEKEASDCTICQKTFETKGKLGAHMKIHDEKLVICAVCGYRTRTDGLLKQHMISHSEKKPFKCSLCEKTFKTNSHRKKHQECHNSDKKFPCPICGKCFHTNMSVSRHIRRFHQEKRHVCGICYLKCTTRGALRRHSIVHTCEKPYTCKFCGKQFTWERNRKAHMQKAHSQ